MAQRLFAMEENNRPANNEERNIFYEYFSNLKPQNKINETEINLKVKELHHNTLATFQNLLELSDEYSNSYSELKQEVTLNNINEYYKGLLEILSEDNTYKQFIQYFIDELSYYISLFNLFNLPRYSKFAVLLKEIIVIKSSLENKQNTQFSGFTFCFNCINLVDHFFNIIPLITKKNHRSIYNKGCNILELCINQFVEIVFDGVKDIYNIINGNFSEIAIDVANIISTYSSTESYNYYDKKKSTQISMIREYLAIAEYAYNDNTVKIPIYYSPITNYSIFNTDKGGYFNLGMMYACLLRCNNNNEINIGFGGTVTKISNKCLKTILTDISQLCNVSTAYIYAAGTVTQIKEDYPNSNITLCGHSLGGGLAQFAAAPHNKRVKAFCYNSAGLLGAYKAIERFLPVKDIYHYRLENDIISRFGKLIGDVYTIKYTQSCCKSHGIDAIKDAIK